MKVSYNWLKEWVDIPVDPQKLAEELTNVGLQLQGMEKTANDAILDFEITVNRPDCLCVRGLVREIGTIFGSLAQSLPAVKDVLRIRVEQQEGSYSSNESTPLKIILEDPDLCPRYCGQIITRVRVGPSPDWLIQKLESSDIRSINNVVDVTNLVMLELGQPMHAFDYARLAGGTIRVRRARNEMLKMIDGKERLLRDPMLVIADAERAVAVGGVMGGFDSEVTEATTTVLLESAYFNPSSVRSTAKALELSTDASYRFERGVDFELQATACRRAAELLEEISASDTHAILDVFAGKFNQPEIELRPIRVERVLGLQIEQSFIERTLTSLGFVKIGENRWRVPPFRVDVFREIDLIEEVARHFGYNRFPDTLPEIAGKPQADYATYELERKVSKFLCAARIDETYTYSFINPTASVFIGTDCVKITNPLSEAASELRISLIPNLIDAVEYNLRHRNEDVRLFEIGRIFLRDEEKIALGIVILGDYEDLKGVVEGLFPALNFPKPHLEQGRIVSGGVQLGELQQRMVASRPVQVCEIYLSDLVSLPKQELRYRPIIPFPYVERDVSFILSEGIPYAEIESVFKQLRLENLRSYHLVDRYKGPNTPPGKLSLTFKLVYQSENRTLTSEEVDQLHNKIIEEFSHRFGAELRK